MAHRPAEIRISNDQGLRLPSLVTIASLVSIAFVALLTWRWFDANVLSLGINNGETTVVNQAQLVEKIRAFEIGSVKHIYKGNAQVDASKELNAGFTDIGLPSWLAGQRMAVNGRVMITAGADMTLLRKEDVRIVRQGDNVEVTILLPSAQILSAEIVPWTMNIETSQGLITRASSHLGLSEKDLKDDALDRLVAVAKEAALKNGLMDEAQRELKWRVEGFLHSLPPTGREHVTYVVQTRPGV
jgi:hypothetical protein